MADRNLKFEGAGMAPVVYVRPVRPDELPAEARKATLYGIHDEAGNRIGVAPERELAFLAARQHELRPVSVH